MKMQLSTALLSISLIGVCIGWATDRTRWKTELSELSQNRKHREARIYRGASVEARAYGAFDEISGLFSEFDKKHSNQHMVVRIQDVFKNSADIEFANSEVGEHSHSNGLLIAKKMLASMECDSADEFFEIARASLLLRLSLIHISEPTRPY